MDATHPGWQEMSEHHLISLSANSKKKKKKDAKYLIVWEKSAHIEGIRVLQNLVLFIISLN